MQRVRQRSALFCHTLRSPQKRVLQLCAAAFNCGAGVRLRLARLGVVDAHVGVVHAQHGVRVARALHDTQQRAVRRRNVQRAVQLGCAVRHGTRGVHARHGGVGPITQRCECRARRRRTPRIA